MGLLSKKKLFQWHGWLGLNLGLLLFVICFSGTICVVSNELDWLLDPNLRIQPKDKPVKWQKIYNNVQKAYPNGKIYYLLEQKNVFTEVGDYFTYFALVLNDSGEWIKVHVNPYSGLIQGSTPFLDVQRFFRSFHNDFFDGTRGVYVVTSFSFFLLLSVMTGFLFYKSWFKNLFRLRLKKGIRVLLADSHKLAGIWSLLFALIIALTGIWFLTEKVVFDIMGENGNPIAIQGPTNTPDINLKTLGSNPKFVPIDSLVHNAEEAFPHYQVEGVFLPNGPSDYVRMDGQDSNPFTRDRANRVYANPYTGEIMDIIKAKDLTALQFTNNIVDPLHFGTFGGLGVKILWFLFGLVLSFSILAGTYLWYLRRTKKLETRISFGEIARKSMGKQKMAKVKMAIPFWKSLRLVKGAVVSTAIVVIYLVGTGISAVKDGFLFWSGYPEGYTATLTHKKLGPWPMEVQCEYPCTLEAGTTFKARIESEGMPNYSVLNLQLLTKQGDTISMPFQGFAKFPRLTLDNTIADLEISKLGLLVADHQGNLWETEIPTPELNGLGEQMKERFPIAPTKNYPDVPHVYMVAAIFTLLVVIVIVAWCIFLVRAVIKEQRLYTLSG